MGWQLEVAKMFLYLAFPVSIFHVFNQPQIFEEQILKHKAERYPPGVIEQGLMLREQLDEIRRRKELEEMQAMQAEENAKI